MSEPSPEPAELINLLSAEYDRRLVERHEAGQEKYGTFSFLEKDMIEEALQELLDFSNYMRYGYIKLRMTQLALSEDPRLQDAEMPTIGAHSFRRAE